MDRSRVTYVLISLYTLCASLMLIWELPMSNWWYSILMCANFSWILYAIWKTERFSPFFLFLSTFIFLFIGGRFWATLLSYPETELQRGNFFSREPIPEPIWLDSLTFILLLLYTASIAYILYPRKNRDKPIITSYAEDNFLVNTTLQIVWCMLAPFIIYDIAHKFAVAIFSGGGYLSLYANQMENVVPGSGFVASMLYVFFGLAITLGNKRSQRLYLILVFLKALVFILIGQRGKFGAMMLFFIWYYYKDKKIRITRLAVFAIVGIILLAAILALSSREHTGYEPSGPLTMLTEFLFSQGVSLTTFTFSQQIETYPTLPYFVSFIPGAASFYSLLIGDLPAYESSFANFLAYNLNPETYEQGHGLGWTLLSDFYLYGERSFIGFTILSILFGWVCAWLEDAGRTSVLAACVVFTTFLNFTFLPRAGLYTIIPLIVWLLIIYYIFTSLIKIKQKPI